MNSAHFDITDVILSLHGIALWCAMSGVIYVVPKNIVQTGVKLVTFHYPKSDSDVLKSKSGVKVYHFKSLILTS